MVGRLVDPHDPRQVALTPARGAFFAVYLRDGIEASYATIDIDCPAHHGTRIVARFPIDVSERR